MVAIGRVVQGAFLVNDADRRLVRADGYFPDVVETILQLRMQLHGTFDCGLRMEFRREGNLEQHVFHDVRTVGALELEFLALEQHVVETPGLCRQGRRITHLAGTGDHRQPDCAARGIPRRPALARTGVGGMAIGAQALTVHPGQRDRIDDLFAGQAKHACHDSGGGHFDQHNVVEADFIEAVFQREAALDFMRFDHRREHVLNRERLPADRHCVTRQPIGGRENAAQVVGRMPPFRGQPGVVEIQPADHRADIERGLHRIELERRSGHLGAIGHDGAGTTGPSSLVQAGYSSASKPQPSVSIRQ